jgi:hypothetical protein
VLCDTAAKIGHAVTWNERIGAVEHNGIESIAGVEFQHLMDWVWLGIFGVICPELADELVWRETFERFEPSSEIVCVDKDAEMRTQLVVAVVVEALYGRFLDGPIHLLDLTIRPKTFSVGRRPVSCSRQIWSKR